MKTKILLYAPAIAAIASPAAALAATAPRNVLTTTSQVEQLFCTVLVWMFWGLIVLGVAMALVGGYIYATSGGESEKVEKGRKTLTYAAIAIVVAILAKGIPELIGNFLGANPSVQVCAGSTVTVVPGALPGN